MISLESIILLAVIGLVLFIDKVYTKKQEYINGELVIVTNNKKKNYLAFEKNNIVFWFPLVFLIIGIFIGDDINFSIYEQTGFIYDSLAAWLIIFYYVSFFSYKSLSIVKTVKKIISTEILYFFTVILLSFLMHFSTQFFQASNDKFVVQIQEDLIWILCQSGEIDCTKNNNSNVIEKNKLKKVTYSYDGYSNRDFKYLYDGLYYEEFEIVDRANELGLSLEEYLIKNPTITQILNRILVNKKSEFYYNYQTPLINSKNSSFIDEKSSYLILFLKNLLIIGYVWRFVFMLILWSVNNLLKESI